MALHRFPDFIGYSAVYVILMRRHTGPMSVHRANLLPLDVVVSLICLQIGRPWLLRTEIPGLPRSHVVIGHPVLTYARILLTNYMRGSGICLQALGCENALPPGYTNWDLP